MKLMGRFTRTLGPRERWGRRLSFRGGKSGVRRIVEARSGSWRWRVEKEGDGVIVGVVEP